MAANGCVGYRLESNCRGAILAEQGIRDACMRYWAGVDQRKPLTRLIGWRVSRLPSATQEPPQPSALRSLLQVHRRSMAETGVGLREVPRSMRRHVK
jgi:hypothetical protein